MKGGKRDGAGRPKGVGNRKTESLRERVEILIDNNWEKLQDDLNELTSKERVDTIVKLLEYSLPKLSRTEHKEVYTIEELLMMTPEQRRARMEEIRAKIKEQS